LSAKQDPRYVEIDEKELSRERMLAFGALSNETLAEDDLPLALLAKSREIRDARGLGRAEHAVVAGAELLGLLPRLHTDGSLDKSDDKDELGKHIVWALKYAAGAALDIPEIPFAAVDELLRVLGDLLVEFGCEPYALWQLEARRYFIEGEDEKLKERVELLLPHVNRSNHFFNHLDCPGCSLVAFARYLGSEASPEAVLEVLRPLVLGGGLYTNEPEHFRSLMNLIFGERETCKVALFAAHAQYARALARNGRAAEGRRHAAQALRDQRASGLAHTVLPSLAELTVARRMDEHEETSRSLVALLERIPSVEDAYERLEALIETYQAAKELGRPADELATLEQQAIACAKRLDARLRRPRHLRETQSALES